MQGKSVKEVKGERRKVKRPTVCKFKLNSQSLKT